MGALSCIYVNAVQFAHKPFRYPKSTTRLSTLSVSFYHLFPFPMPSPSILYLENSPTLPLILALHREVITTLSAIFSGVNLYLFFPDLHNFKDHVHIAIFRSSHFKYTDLLLQYTLHCLLPMHNFWFIASPSSLTFT